MGGEIQVSVIWSAIKQRAAGHTMVCPLCGGTRWHVDGVINLPLQDQDNTNSKMLPLINFSCIICGNTMFFNLVTLLGREQFERIAKEGHIDQILREAHEAHDGGTKEV